MTMLTNETKAKKMRGALATLAAEYLREARHKDAHAVHVALAELSGGDGIKANNESLARLFDILTTEA
jgi:hypothetical protein